MPWAALAAALPLVALASAPNTAPHLATPPNFTVAFIGDQGVGANAVAVLQLISDEGADMVLHQGDLGYTTNANAWDQQITDVLGAEFPYFASIGNHDCNIGPLCSGPGSWPDYQQKLQQRLDKVAGATCTGDLGVNSACQYRGIFFILSGAGTLGTGHAAFITSALATDVSLWKICSWHKNQQLMQVGSKTDEVDWEPYDACRGGGAIIATGHEHSYERTHLMDNIEAQSIASTSSTLGIEKGKTFVFVSGLGGQSIRGTKPPLDTNPWWASVYTSVQGANFGALFCAFNYQGVGNQAHCYFKDIDGNVPDVFDVVSASAPFPPVPALEWWVVAALALALAGATLVRRRGGRHVAGG